jgi:hypothetical protein
MLICITLTFTKVRAGKIYRVQESKASCDKFHLLLECPDFIGMYRKAQMKYSKSFLSSKQSFEKT